MAFFEMAEKLTVDSARLRREQGVAVKRCAWALALVMPLLVPFAVGAVDGYKPPLWELGPAIGVISAPDYRGSARTNAHVIPFPYVAYRGEKWRLDEEGLRARWLRGDKWDLNVRVAGNLAVEAEEDSKRQGMHELDPVIEAGPSLEYRLWQSAPTKRSLWFRMPWRLMSSVGSPWLRYQGWTFAPYLEFVKEWQRPQRMWKAALAAGPQYGSRAYHNYFYEVEAQYETAERSEYHPDRGYGGSRVTLTVTSSGRQFWVGAFARYDDLNGAAFDDSPLVEKKTYFACGVALGWILYRR